MFEIREANAIESLADYRAQWAGLLAETRGASFFQSFDWLESYWRHFGGAQRLRVLLVEREGRLIGVLPLAVRSEPTRLGPVRILTYPLHDWGTFFGPIGPDPAAVLEAGLAHIGATHPDWDVLDLRWVDDDLDAGATQRAFRLAGLPSGRAAWSHSAQVELAGTWNTYWASRTSRWRNNVRRSEKRLARSGPIEHVRYRPRGFERGEGDPRWDLYDLCEQIARESWQARSKTGTTLIHETIRPFLRDAHLAAARAGALDLNLLFVGGRPAAFNYAYHCRGSLYGLRTGYIAEAALAGAGSVLQTHMIRDSFSRGDRLYDLGSGYLECKRYWRTRIVTSYRYTYYQPGVRPQILRAKRMLQGWWTGRKVPARLASATGKSS